MAVDRWPKKESVAGYLCGQPPTLKLFKQLLMKQIMLHRPAIKLLLLLLVIVLLSACGRESSPEGRMQMKMESLQKELIDSLRNQNNALLDSISSLRRDVQALQSQQQKR
jgi:hypothetical protein